MRLTASSMCRCRRARFIGHLAYQRWKVGHSLLDPRLSSCSPKVARRTPAIAPMASRVMLPIGTSSSKRWQAVVDHHVLSLRRGATMSGSGESPDGLKEHARGYLTHRREPGISYHRRAWPSVPSTYLGANPRPRSSRPSTQSTWLRSTSSTSCRTLPTAGRCSGRRYGG